MSVFRGRARRECCHLEECEANLGIAFIMLITFLLCSLKRSNSAGVSFTQPTLQKTIHWPEHGQVTGLAWDTLSPENANDLRVVLLLGRSRKRVDIGGVSWQAV